MFWIVNPLLPPLQPPSNYSIPQNSTFNSTLTGAPSLDYPLDELNDSLLRIRSCGGKSLNTTDHRVP